MGKRGYRGFPLSANSGINELPEGEKGKIRKFGNRWRAYLDECKKLCGNHSSYAV